jgi:1-acyl-sn-glycerol-3-phosphate acyltransferase
VSTKHSFSVSWWFMGLVGRSILRVSGWRIGEPPPDLDRYVLIAAPHTTNWDLVYTLAIGTTLGMRVAWMGKHTLFRGPLGWFLRAMGGLPIDRRSRGDLVQRMAEEFARRETLVLTVPPEGTRSYAKHWKSGFYHIALAAGVPVVLGYLDYAKKQGGFGPAVRLTGDMDADMERIRAFYADKKGKYPENFGPVRLREQDPRPAVGEASTRL